MSYSTTLTPPLGSDPPDSHDRCGRGWRHYISVKSFMYKYYTGELVKVGDWIFYPKPFGNGRVSLILFPQSLEACEWGLPTGAVMRSFDQHENAIAISNPEQDEDLVFLGRE